MDFNRVSVEMTKRYEFSTESYATKLARELKESHQRAMGRTLDCAADPEFGCPGGVIEVWGGRLHFPEIGPDASVVGYITEYKAGMPCVWAEIQGRGKCMVFPDGSAIQFGQGS